MLGRLPFSGPRPALYSEVVSPRTPSPLRENSSETVLIPEGNPFPERDLVGRTPPEIKVVPTDSRENIRHIEENISSNEDTSPKDLGSEWTTVKRRRARSLESSFELIRKGLTKEQTQSVNGAADTLTKSQKETLSHRQRKLTHRRDSRPLEEKVPLDQKEKILIPGTGET